MVIAVEGLGTGLVGAYGSSTAVTPAIDSLAANGILLDQCFVDSQQLERQVESLWTARHALQPGEAQWNLWRDVADRETDDWNGRLLTDSVQVAEAADRAGCPSVTLIEPTQPDRPATETSGCAVMDLFAAAAAELASGPPGLIWIHSRGLRLPWDAPLELRGQFADPEDPPPPADTCLPETDVDRQTDPDWLVGWGQVAAAQSAVIDEAISALLHSIAGRSDASAWAWVLATLGGVPLGVHGRLGWGRPQLYGEELHTATIISPAERLPIGLRRPELFQLPDVAASVAELLALPLPSELWGRSVLQYGTAEAPQRWPSELSIAMIANERQSWIRSPAWSALLPVESADHVGEPLQTAQLFVKPEDRWEVSQIAERRREVVERHRELAMQFRQACQDNQRSQLPLLEDELINLLR